MTGVKTSDLQNFDSVDTLLGSNGKSIGNISLYSLIGIILARQGPPFETRGSLFADVNWPDGAVGTVFGDSTEAFNGVYKKSGAVGGGSWAKIGALPVPPATVAALANKVEVDVLDEQVSILTERDEENFTFLEARISGKIDQSDLDEVANALNDEINVLDEKRIESFAFLAQRLADTNGNGDVFFSVTDADGRRSWLECNSKGLPTLFASDLIRDTVAPTVNDNQVVFSITDENGLRSWLECNSLGLPTPFAVSAIQAAVSDTTNLFISRYTPDISLAEKTYPMASGPDIVCWGDSMTAGVGGGGTTFPSVLAELTGRNVVNSGVGGETSVSIAARAGATPYQVSFDNGLIPASGAADVSLEDVGGEATKPLIQGDGIPTGSMTGTLYPSGVRGTLTVSGIVNFVPGQYHFTRETNGGEVAVDRPQAFISDFAISRRQDIAIIWIGQNGPSDARAIIDAKAIIQELNAADKRWLVVPRPTASAASSQLFFEEFGRRAVLITDYITTPIFEADGVTISSCYGLDDAGIVPTSQDRIDIENGKIPTSLRSDFVHWTGDGYRILAEQLRNRMAEFGWLD